MILEGHDLGDVIATSYTLELKDVDTSPRVTLSSMWQNDAKEIILNCNLIQKQFYFSNCSTLGIQKFSMF